MRELEPSNKSQNQKPSELKSNQKCHQWEETEEHHQVPNPRARLLETDRGGVGVTEQGRKEKSNGTTLEI